MIKKQIYIYFLFIASFLQLGHSLFPHTHVKEHHHNGEHHHHHSDEENSEENGLSHFFSHFNHNADAFSNSQLEEVVKIIKEVPNQVFVLNSTSVFTKSIEYYPKKEVVRYKELLVFISPHLHSLQFRGPPTIFS